MAGLESPRMTCLVGADAEAAVGSAAQTENVRGDGVRVVMAGKIIFFMSRGLLLSVW